MTRLELPIPYNFKEEKTEQIWKVDYQQRAEEARDWAYKYNIKPASQDKFKICLVLVDVQNTFCNPEFELFVAGRSGKGAIEDNIRLCKFIYRNLDLITEIIPTMDTHQAIQIFHSIFLLNEEGKHPAPYTLISVEDVEKGIWRINPEVSEIIGLKKEKAQEYLLHYTKELKDSGKYNLTIWPYHAMLGGIGHALVPAIEEAIFFHSIARFNQPDFQIKGRNPLTEHYSAFGPEVKRDIDEKQIAEKNTPLIEKLQKYDAVIITGQAKSHCVAWTIDDLLQEKKDIAKKIYLLEDATSPVVIPGAIDFTEAADKAFKKFADAGTKIVRSTEPLESWKGMMV